VSAAVAVRYTSGHCSSGARGGHARCAGGYGGACCDCPCHAAPEPEPDPEPAPVSQSPAARLARAADTVRTGQPLPPGATAALARLLHAESVWAADRRDGYPTDRAPLIELADLINGGVL
jgi:hypothetical protein